MSPWGPCGIRVGLPCPHSPTVHPQLLTVGLHGYVCSVAFTSNCVNWICASIETLEQLLEFSINLELDSPQVSWLNCASKSRPLNKIRFKQSHGALLALICKLLWDICYRRAYVKYVVKQTKECILRASSQLLKLQEAKAMKAQQDLQYLSLQTQSLYDKCSFTYI